MSEFKFACPVCGQHITADSSSSGMSLDCPTCFQTILVPQAPASAQTKFILSATQVRKRRHLHQPGAADASSQPKSRKRILIPLLSALGIALLGAGGTAVWLWHARSVAQAKPVPSSTNAPVKALAVTSARNPTYPVPTNSQWTLDLTKVVLPEAPAAGRIQGSGFIAERASLQGGNLSLRQGKAWPPDLGINVMLFAKQGEELSGKTVQVTPDRAPPVPRVVLRWKDNQQQGTNSTFNSGYALKISFGQAANGRIPGKLYLAFPDEAKSFVSGTFEAEIRKPSAPKPNKPKAPKASG